jgi:hypothetical protein
LEATLDQLRNPPEWNRYSFTWVQPQLDKTGEVLRRPTRGDDRRSQERLREPLDGYVKLLLPLGEERAHRPRARSAPRRAGVDPVGTSSSSSPGTAGLRPYNKWLEWELRNHPLPVELDLERLERIARTGALEDQRALFREAEALARKLGRGATIDGWEPDVEFLRGH